MFDHVYNTPYTGIFACFHHIRQEDARIRKQQIFDTERSLDISSAKKHLMSSLRTAAHPQYGLHSDVEQTLPGYTAHLQGRIAE